MGLMQPAILHGADLHVGKKYGPGRIDHATGLLETTCRELRVLEEIVDIALYGPDPEARMQRKAQEPERGPIPPCPGRVKVMVLAGDLLDYPGPVSARIQRAIQHQVLRLARGGITVIIIPGNHDHPKTRDDGSVYALYEEFDEMLGIHAVYKGVYERVPREGAIDDMVFHCVPHTYTPEQLREELALAADQMRQEREEEERRGVRHRHILVSHLQVNTTSIPAYRYSSRESMQVDLADIDQGFDLILLGDYHKQWDHEGRIFYAPCCRNRFDEADQHPHAIAYAFTPEGVQHQRHYLTSVQPMLDLVPIDCLSPETGEFLDVAEINRLLHERTADCDRWSEHMVRLVIRNAPRGLMEAIDHRRIAQVEAACFWFVLDVRYRDMEEAVAGGEDAESEPVHVRVVEKLRRRTSERLLAKVMPYLREVYPELAPSGEPAGAAAGAPAEAEGAGEAGPGAEPPVDESQGSGAGDASGAEAAAQAGAPDAGADEADPLAALAALPNLESETENPS